MIDEARIDEVLAAIGTAGVSQAQVAALRTRFAELPLTYCMDEDVYGAEPVHEGDGFNLYLLDANEHCPQLTGDLHRASGLVLAEVLPEDA